MTRQAIRQRQSRGTERVTLRIDRLDLHGFAPCTARRIADGLSRALVRELMALDALPDVARGQDRAVAEMPEQGPALPEDFGAVLARRIVGRITS